MFARRSTFIRCLLAFVPFAAAASPALLAHAQPDSAAPLALGQTRPAEPPPPPREDPSTDRAFMSPTALTLPQGSVVVSSYQIILAGITYAPLERLQATLNFEPLALLRPNHEEGPMLSASLKWQAVKVWRL